MKYKIGFCPMRQMFGYSLTEEGRVMNLVAEFEAQTDGEAKAIFLKDYQLGEGFNKAYQRNFFLFKSGERDELVR